MQEELYQRRDECLQLHALLSSRDSQSTENIINPLISSDELELKMAYNSQRDLKRLIIITLYRSTLSDTTYLFHYLRVSNFTLTIIFCLTNIIDEHADSLMTIYFCMFYIKKR